MERHGGNKLHRIVGELTQPSKWFAHKTAHMYMQTLGGDNEQGNKNRSRWRLQARGLRNLKAVSSEGWCGKGHVVTGATAAGDCLIS
jgi:hypothetical protein